MNHYNQSVCDVNSINLVNTKTCYRYNMSIIQRYPYRISADGIFDKNHPTLTPIDWIKSNDGKEHIYKIYSKTDDIVSLFKFNSLNTSTTSFYVWLGYLKHCIGNIETAIAAELVTYD